MFEGPQFHCESGTQAALAAAAPAAGQPPDGHLLHARLPRRAALPVVGGGVHVRRPLQALPALGALLCRGQ